MSGALDDTIAAIATAPGAAGLAVVRVSGAAALPIADAVFRGRAALGQQPTHTLHHGWALGAGGERLDEVMAAIFRSPRSYTREDVVELSCHGGDVSAARVLAALRAAGARAAGPGEFTLRAFLRGRLDLAQSEAVADLIHAETAAAADLALSQLAGALSRRVHELAERVADAAAEVEARVDFAEDVGGIEVPENVRAAIAAALAELEALLAGAAWARAIRGGVPAAIVGRPNAGKSSLFNALVGEARAIVTAEPGTTRDRVSEAIELAGVRVTLSDTAGLREGRSEAEALGIARAHEALAGAAVVLWVIDGSEPLADDAGALAARLAGRRVLAVLHKADLPLRADAAQVARCLAQLEHRIVAASAKTGAGLAEVRAALGELLGVSAAGGLAGAVADPRHADALGRAHAALARARAVAEAGAPGEIVALELREALAALGEVTGTNVGADLLERIFSRFCIGK